MLAWADYPAIQPPNGTSVIHTSKVSATFCRYSIGVEQSADLFTAVGS
jgi:hypothetical protein